VNFSELFIRRPVLTVVTAVLILLLGIQGFLNMSIREYPEVEETVITIQTVYPGAGADLMQGFITTPLAKAVLNAEGVDYVTSSSTLGSSTVTVNMLLDTDPDQALVDVISKVQQVRGQLPTDAEDPVVQKGTGQNFALMYLAVRSRTMNPEQVTEYLTRVIQPRFTTVTGVGEVQILGGREFAMRVWLDPVRLAARKRDRRRCSERHPVVQLPVRSRQDGKPDGRLFHRNRHDVADPRIVRGAAGPFERRRSDPPPRRGRCGARRRKRRREGHVQRRGGDLPGRLRHAGRQSARDLGRAPRRAAANSGGAAPRHGAGARL
jgi:hypothetical protein